MAWLINEQLFSPEIHVVPEDDKKRHVEAEDRCWCVPKVDEVFGQYIITHNSADLREWDEQYLSWIDRQEPPITGRIIDVRYL